jgi:hypothetical protein
MTPQEKAIELLSKMYSVDEWDDYNDPTMSYKHAKKCALIAVDEIIKTFRKDLPEIGLGKGFWGEVKNEMKKL